ncbi:MAG: VTC domain-containing protein [Winogradskyella sp.]|uniref:VTC domain-containing protein n=1 Tax=Winogradskyella sp. TaxID=1883156 RepID=UPI00385C7331
MEKAVNNTYRFERKIVVDSHSYDDLIYMFKARGFSKLFPERNICNLYLDDLNHSAYFDNILGNSKRLKHRIRWYGNLFGTVKKITLEQKIKRGNVGLKKNFKVEKEFDFSPTLTFSQLTKLVRHVIHDLRDNIFVDILYPASINTYTRSYYSDAFNRFRITFDKDIKYYSFQNRIKLEKTDPRIIIEIKYDNENDLLASQILEFFNFRLSKNSKYVNGVECTKY